MIPLRTSHVLYYAAIVTLTLTAVVGVGFWFSRQEMLTGNDFLLDAESQEIIARIAQIPLPINAKKLEDALQEHTKNDEALFYFQVQDLNPPRTIFRSPNLGEGRLPELNGGAAKRTLAIEPLGLVREAQYVTPAVRMQIAMSLRNFQTVSDYFWLMLLVGVPVIGALSIAFGLALRRSTLKPMRLMQDTARRISATNLSERIPIPESGGDMEALGRLLNEMFDRLERSFNQVKRFTADTSHELMTPLSIIQLHSERLLNDPDLPEKHRHSAEELLQVGQHLTQTLERLMVLTRADSSILPLKLKAASTREFMAQFAEDAQLLAESRGRKLSMSKNEDRVMVFDEGWIRQILFNLLSNALRFSPPGSTIVCGSWIESGLWTVEVMDEGCGVPPDRLEDIFERFVQIAPRSEPGNGSGLGLAICKSIIQLHRGQISARNRSDRSGLVVQFALPTDLPAQPESSAPTSSGPRPAAMNKSEPA